VLSCWTHKQHSNGIFYDAISVKFYFMTMAHFEPGTGKLRARWSGDRWLLSLVRRRVPGHGSGSLSGVHNFLPAPFSPFSFDFWSRFFGSGVAWLRRRRWTGSGKTSFSSNRPVRRHFPNSLTTLTTSTAGLLAML